MTRHIIRIVMSIFIAGAAQAAPATPPRACDLLAAESIQAAQRDTLKERKGSEHDGKGLHYSQCVFETGDFVRSVSVTLISGGIGEYWERTFGAGQRLGRKNPPRAVTVAGQPAFWTSDQRAGVLYVRSGDVVLRISVGGQSDDEERLRRTSALAEVALRRLGGD